MNIKPVRGNDVKWPSVYLGSTHVFKGRVVKVLGEVAVVDDGLGLSYRCIPLARLEVIGGACRFAGYHA